jgi:hypothetical protein
MRLFALVLGFTTIACGDGGGDGGADAPPLSKDGALYIQDAGALPECNAEAEGRLAYVKAEATFKACSGGAWANVDVKGPKGDKGDPGGADGGGAFGIAEQWSCKGSGDLDAEADEETRINAVTVIKFLNGDYFISCMDRQVNSQFTYADASANSSFASSKSNGVTSGAVMCTSFYAFAVFATATGQVAYGPNGGQAKETLQCDKLSAP